MPRNLICPVCGSESIVIIENSGYSCPECGYKSARFSDHIAQVLSELHLFYEHIDCTLSHCVGKASADQSYLIKINNNDRDIVIRILQRTSLGDLLPKIIELLKKYRITDHYKILIREVGCTPNMACPFCHGKFNYDKYRQLVVCGCESYFIDIQSALSSVLNLHHKLVYLSSYEPTYFFSLFGEAGPTVQVTLLTNESNESSLVVRETALSSEDHLKLVLDVTTTLRQLFNIRVIIGKK